MLNSAPTEGSKAVLQDTWAAIVNASRDLRTLCCFQEKARAKAYQEKQAPAGKKTTPFWAKAPWEMVDDLVGGTSYESDDEQVTRERTASGMSRAKAMAAAARRWRDASRAGKDRKPKFALPPSKEEELVRR
jgi:hypothetical protein